MKNIEFRNTKILTIGHGNYIIHISMDSVLRIIIITLSIAGLLYGRWIVMAGTKPEFKPTDNPAAFAERVYIKVHKHNLYV